MLPRELSNAPRPWGWTRILDRIRSGELSHVFKDQFSPTLNCYSLECCLSLILNALTSEDLFRTVEADATPTDSQESERWKGVYITHLNWLQNMPGVKKLVRLIEQLLCVRIMKQNGSIVLNGDSVLCRIAASLLNVVRPM